MARSEFDQLRTAEREPTSIKEALTRGVAYTPDNFRMVLPDSNSLEVEMGKRRIRLYLGIDPTSPELHIGHTVPLRKLRQFQDLGHEVILLFGTFTGKIGDPSGKDKTRIPLTDEQIATNMADYAQQASKILDLSTDAENPIKIMKNGDWLSPLTFNDVVDLAAQFSVQQMMARSQFKKRWDEQKTISLHEFLYPLMQGYDSVAMDVDLEVGGKDQVPNMMDGRTLVQTYKNHEKWVLGTQLIEDPSGKKMGKTEGNIVGIRELPEVKYEAVMTWADSMIPMGFELVTSVPMEQVYILSEMMERGEINPLEAKEALAYRVVAELDGVQEAQFAQDEFSRVKREGKLPQRITEVQVVKGSKISEVLVASGLAKDPEEAAMKIAQKSIYIDGKQTKDVAWPDSAATISVGKKTIKNVRRVIAQ